MKKSIIRRVASRRICPENASIEKEYTEIKDRQN